MTNLIPSQCATVDPKRAAQERDVLAESIRNAVVAAGMCRPDISLSGPELIVLCHEMGSRIAHSPVNTVVMGDTSSEDAVRMRAAIAESAKPIEWSPAQMADTNIHLDHVIAKTALGDIVITWGWKGSPSCTIEQHPNGDACETEYDDLDDAMAEAVLAYKELLQKPTDGLASTSIPVTASLKPSSAPHTHSIAVAALQEMASCDGSSANVASAAVLAARVRDLATKALNDMGIPVAVPQAAEVAPGSEPRARPRP